MTVLSEINRVLGEKHQNVNDVTSHQLERALVLMQMDKMVLEMKHVLVQLEVLQDAHPSAVARVERRMKTS